MQPQKRAPAWAKEGVRWADALLPSLESSGRDQGSSYPLGGQIRRAARQEAA